jgi:hypothetical protein
VSLGKFFIGLLLLPGFAAQSHAQWNPVLNATQTNNPANRCRNVAIRVEDSRGIGIMGAVIIPEDHPFPIMTDSQGFAAIPCHGMSSILRNVKISAPGYAPINVAVMTEARSNFDIRLDRSEPANQRGDRIVTAAELSVDIQKRSAGLQHEATKALAAKDLDRAGELLLEAQHLTPSSASIMNNLGIVALNRKDLDSAGTWFQKAAEAAPYNGQIRGNLGLVFWMQHRSDESYSHLARAVSMGYQSHLANYILGVVGLEKGQSAESIKYLKKIPADRFPYRDWYLSIALRNCGKNKAADESFRKFLQRNPAPFFVHMLR